MIHASLPGLLCPVAAILTLQSPLAMQSDYRDFEKIITEVDWIPPRQGKLLLTKKLLSQRQFFSDGVVISLLLESRHLGAATTELALQFPLSSLLHPVLFALETFPTVLCVILKASCAVGKKQGKHQ